MKNSANYQNDRKNNKTMKIAIIDDMEKMFKSLIGKIKFHIVVSPKALF